MCTSATVMLLLMTERVARADSMALMKLSELLLLLLLLVDEMRSLGSLVLAGRIVPELCDLRAGEDRNQVALH